MMKQIKTALLAASVSLAALSAGATSMIPANLGLIVQYTDKAFVGTAGDTQVVQTPQGWAEQVTFTVTDPILPGVKAGESVSWVQIRSNESTPFPGMPRFEKGKEYAIFLAGKAPGSELQAPYALGQGTFRIHRDKENGAAFARNEFQNSALFLDMDTEALGDAMVDQQPGARNLAAGQRSAKAKANHARLHALRAGAIDLSTLKDAAKALKASGSPRTRFAKKGGASNATPLRDPAPVR